jgi:hypothetical protein
MTRSLKFATAQMGKPLGAMAHKSCKMEISTAGWIVGNFSLIFLSHFHMSRQLSLIT